MLRNRVKSSAIKNKLYGLLAVFLILLSLFVAFFAHDSWKSENNIWLDKAKYQAGLATGQWSNWLQQKQEMFLTMIVLYEGSNNVTRDEFYSSVELIEYSWEQNRTVEVAVIKLDDEAGRIEVINSSIIQPVFLSANSTRYFSTIQQALNLASQSDHMVLSNLIQLNDGSWVALLCSAIKSSKDKHLFIVSMVDLQVLLENLVELRMQPGLTTDIFYRSVSDGVEVLLPNDSDSDTAKKHSFDIRLVAMGSKWTFRWYVDSSYLEGPDLENFFIILLGGFFVVLLIGFFGFVLINENDLLKRESSRRKQVEEQLNRNQKMEALGKLTGGIAHDYNNMLGVIMGYASLLEDAFDKQSKHRKFAREIRHAAERGAKLTQKMLSFSRKKSSDAKVVDINSLLRDQQHMLESTLTARIGLVFDLSENLWLVELDDNDLEDAILNMSINAMHAIEGTGKVIYRTHNVTLSEDDAKLLDLSKGDYVCLNITDTGSGISDDIRQKIFDPFFTTKAESGTGLGLSQVYGFVTRSGGAIKLESKKNRGASFTFYFPRYYGDIIDEQPSSSNLMDKLLEDKVILVVDDEKSVLELACEILGRHKIKVLSASHAEQALEILDKQPVDLMLSDVIMPDIDGYELAAMVKEAFPQVRIQLMSGFSDNKQRDYVDESLQKNLLKKPFLAEDLMAKIHDLLA